MARIDLDPERLMVNEEQWLQARQRVATFPIKDVKYIEIWNDAIEYANSVASDVVPTPINAIDTMTGQRFAIEGGCCGFATVHVAGNTAFGRAMKRSGILRRDSYRGGNYYSVDMFGQSLEPKEVWAKACVQHLQHCGVEDAYYLSRMD